MILKEQSHVRFIYSEKTTNFCEISTLVLSYVVPVKSRVKNIVAFSEYMNFINKPLVAQLEFWNGILEFSAMGFQRVREFE